MGSDGKLPLGFSLPDDTNENQLKFVAGVMDGMGIYHMGSGGQAETVEKFVPMLEAVLIKEDEKTERAIKEFLKGNRVLGLIEPLLEKLRGRLSEN